MTPDRLDEVLERAIETGQVPAGVTPEERAELEPLLARALDLKLNAARVADEAASAMPAARARFQRHLASQQAAARHSGRAAVPPRRGFIDRFFGGRVMAFATSAAALAVVMVLAIVILQPFSSPETASALEINDYVQFEAVVSEASEGAVVVQAPDIGDLEIALSADTTVTNAEGGARSSLKRGDAVLISGIVTAKRAISATHVAVAPAEGKQALPGADPRKIPVLKELRPGLEGTIALLSLSPDGRQGRVVLLGPNGRLIVRVAPESMDQFLSAENGGVGARVRVVSGEGLPKGVFRLEVIERQDQGQPGPQFQNVRGVVVGRVLNVLQVRTDRGVIPVVVRPLTSVRFGDSGLAPDDIRAGESVIGYEIALSGNPEGPNSRRVIASIIVVIGKAPERPGGQ